MDNCCDSLLKYLIFIFNFFFFLTGIALIAIGAYMKTQMANYLNFLDDSYLNSSVLFIILGVVIFVIGFFGCCGACTENACMLFTFGTLLAVIIVIEIGAAIAVYVFRNDAHQVITKKMQEGMNNYNLDPSSEFAGVTETWNQIQLDFHCCGVVAYRDWGNTSFSQKKDVPDFCCVTSTTGCGKDMLVQGADVGKINQEGCFSKLEEEVKKNVATVGGIAVAVIVLQIVGVLVSCMLANNMRRRANYV